MKLHWQMLVVVAALVLVGSQGRTDDKDLPKGEELMDNYVKVTGGEAVYRKFKTRLAEGTMAVPGGKGPVKIYQKAPNFLLLEAEMPGAGTVQLGTDGKIAWMTNKIIGSTLKSGDEKDQAILDANFYGEVEWRKIYKSVKTVGAEKVDEVPCWKVEFTTMQGKTSTGCFDKKTGYLVKKVAVLESPELGKVQTETHISDYKNVDGLIFPHTVKTMTKVANFTISFTRIQHDVDIPAARFAIPDDVKKLLEKEKQQ